MMKKILLACAGGFSTGMLVQNMEIAAKKKDMEVEIEAVAVAAVDKEIAHISVLLLGPQIGHAAGNIKEKYGDIVPISVIDMLDYGMMNGEKVLELAINLNTSFQKGGKNV